jgi:hypothetical protein
MAIADEARMILHLQPANEGKDKVVLDFLGLTKPVRHTGMTDTIEYSKIGITLTSVLLQRTDKLRHDIPHSVFVRHTSVRRRNESYYRLVYVHHIIKLNELGHLLPPLPRPLNRIISILTNCFASCSCYTDLVVVEERANFTLRTRVDIKPS